MFITPASSDAAVANEWFTTFEGAGLDGIVAKRLDEPYQPDKRALVKVKHQRTADCALAGYRIHKDGQGVGSMLLGLFDDDGVMHHVGVAAAFTVSRRRELLAELAPLTENAIEGHPWAEWAEFATLNQPTGESETQRRPGATSRWNAGKDLSWVPLRVERGRRGDVRAVGERPLPPRRHVRALAPRPHAGELPLRPARRRRPRRLPPVHGNVWRTSVTHRILVVSATAAEAAHVPSGSDVVVTGIGKVAAATATTEALLSRRDGNEHVGDQHRHGWGAARRPQRICSCRAR